LNTVGLLESEMEMSTTLWKTKILVALICLFVVVVVVVFFFHLNQSIKGSKNSTKLSLARKVSVVLSSDFVAICTLSMWGLDRVINVTPNIININ